MELVTVAQPSFRVDRPEVLANPYDLFATMRSEAPVCRLDPIGFWAVSRYEDVMFVLKNPSLFSSAAYNRSNDDYKNVGGLEEAAPTLVGMDPPRHTKMRALIMRAFTPRVVAALEPRIREISRDLVNKIAGKGPFDLVNDFTIPLPMIVIAEMLGVEPDRREDFKLWCDELMTNVAIVKQPDPAKAFAAADALSRYFQKIIEDRRKAPQDDLISMLLAAELDGEKLSMPEVVAFANLLLIAGNETTTSLIGNTFYALTEHPEQYATMLSNRARIPEVVEEVLRWLSPAQLILRLAKEDVTIAGTTIPKGSIVTPLLASANRDERRFANGEAFDIDRDTKGHLAFGLDIHFCLGASLARLEAKVALEELSALGKLKRSEEIVPWAPSLLMRAPLRLGLEQA